MKERKGSDGRLVILVFLYIPHNGIFLGIGSETTKP